MNNNTRPTSEYAIKPSIRELINWRAYAKNIKLFSRQYTHGYQTGNCLSRSRGNGMDFEEVRIYQPGDNIRLMHWPLTARLGKPYTKIYLEERERTMHFIVDQSSTMNFGTRVCFKNVLAANIMSILGWAALGSEESVGGSIFTDNQMITIRPSRSHQSLMKMFNFLINESRWSQQQKKINCFADVLKNYLPKIKPGSIFVIISDFSNFTDEAKMYLKLIRKKCEIINVFIYDPFEKKLPRNHAYPISNGHGKYATINTNNIKHYQNYFESIYKNISNFSIKNNIKMIPMSTDCDIVKTINREVNYHGC